MLNVTFGYESFGSDSALFSEARGRRVEGV
jgi:hypothetical protein